MLKRAVPAEWLKLRHSHLWIVLIALPIVSVLMGCGNFYMNQGVLQNGWYSLWSQAGLFYGEFFLPVLIAICCAYLCRLEHSGKNWNMLLTAPIPVASIFWAKLFTAGMLTAFVQVVFVLLYIIGGTMVGLSLSELPGELYGWLVRGWLAAVTISSFQLLLSMRIRSFAVPVGIGLGAAFLGLGMYVAKAGLFFPHSLLTIGMGVLSPESLPPQQQLTVVIVNLFYIAAFSAGAIYRMRTADVSA
ncbi:multidrug ABC transporter permease [Paenibacillus sp. BIHB 4019]|uniref:Multidrug ABC transporter permease n=1 Tax=Paenibacillus sp. BIHB 4019 TaxID=1870819 RepID=A0A1B2DS37_9BACL|nr:ABC transporter permease [Paenibacillus sp. BIHB 4019]ANY70510.1 multidrug ABC transporter permease [Paenibacillus sp. BIHB 4019]